MINLKLSFCLMIFAIVVFMLYESYTRPPKEVFTELERPLGSLWTPTPDGTMVRVYAQEICHKAYEK